jgi:hypothetical protein
MQRLLSILCLVVLIPGALAQRAGAPITIKIEPKNKYESFSDPQIRSGSFYRWAYLKSRSVAEQLVLIRGTLTASGQVEEVPVRPTPVPDKLSGQYVHDPLGAPMHVIQSWDKKSGRVTIYMQRLAPKDLSAAGPLMEVGVIPLDPKTYEGRTLGISTLISADSTKRALYFDGIQSGGVKLALCWVFDENDEPVWKGGYRIPVQAVGAETEAFLTNAGEVVVKVTAVVLDEDNTKETKDGQVKVKVENVWYKKRKDTYYLIEGERFIGWDGRLEGDITATDLKVAQGANGLEFLAAYQKGERKEATYEYVYGTMSAGFKPNVTNKGAAPGPFIELHHAPRAGFTAGCVNGEVFTVMQFEADGALAWKHEAKFQSGDTWRDFFMAGDHFVCYDSFSPASLKNLLDGEAAKREANAYVTLPALISWDKGQRHVVALLPMDTRYKEAPMNFYPSSLCSEGVTVRLYRDAEPSFTFIPIAWD